MQKLRETENEKQFLAYFIDITWTDVWGITDLPRLKMKIKRNKWDEGMQTISFHVARS